MPSYICIACEFHTQLKGNYSRHINTKKHHRNTPDTQTVSFNLETNIQNNPQNIQNNPQNIQNNPKTSNKKYNVIIAKKNLHYIQIKEDMKYIAVNITQVLLV